MTEAELLTLVLAHADRLTRFGRQLCGDADQAEDLVQETLLHALRVRDQLRDPGRALPWLMQILRRRFLEERRTRARQLRLVESEGAVTPPVIADLEQELLSESLSDEVTAALAVLPEEWRTAVLLADVDELTYEEIATVLECPVGTVRSRIARARAALIEKLAKVAAERGIGRKGRI